MNKLLLNSIFILITFFTFTSCMMHMMQHDSNADAHDTKEHNAKIIKEVINENITITFESQPIVTGEPAIFILKVADNKTRISIKEAHAKLMIDFKRDGSHNHAEHENNFKTVELSTVATEDGEFKFNYLFNTAGTYEIRAEILTENDKPPILFSITQEVQEITKSHEHSAGGSYKLLGILGATGMGLMMGIMMFVFFI